MIKTSPTSTSKVCIDGRLVPIARATIPVFDRAYLYGEGIFTTLRTYHGIPAFVDLHWARLQESCAQLGIRLSGSATTLRRDLIRLRRANKMDDAVLRVSVSAASSPNGQPMQRPRWLPGRVVITARPVLPRPARVYQHGARIILIRTVTADTPTVAQFKSNNGLRKILAHHEVLQARADEGLLCTSRFDICEGIATNIFIVRNGVLITPPVSAGLLPGITRGVVLQLARVLGLRVRESRLRLRDLQTADEMFLTGTTAEVLPVAEICDVARRASRVSRGITVKTPGPITCRLMAAYAQIIAGQIPPN